MNFLEPMQQLLTIIREKLYDSIQINKHIYFFNEFNIEFEIKNGLM